MFIYLYYYIMLDWDIILKLNDDFLGHLRVAAPHQVIQQGGNAKRRSIWFWTHLKDDEG